MKHNVKYPPHYTAPEVWVVKLALKQRIAASSPAGSLTDMDTNDPFEDDFE